MITETQGEVLTLKPQGRIDSGNAAEVELEITAAREAYPHTALIMDAEDLVYISSAGLRVVLRLLKAEPTLKLINVSSDIYDIFDMTGFTEMLPVEKAYRRMSVEGCEIIGQGANGCVYRLDADTIIKVYRDPDSLDDIRRERELARTAFVMGIPTAIPYDVVRVGNSYGSVFELLNAKSFASLIAEQPEELDGIVDRYVKLLKKIHATVPAPGTMSDCREDSIRRLMTLKPYLDADLFEKLCVLFLGVPESRTLMHGDYHIKNVMMQDDEVLLIDMDTLCIGHPIFELEAMFLAYKGYGEKDHSIIADFLGIPYETAVAIWDKSLSLYLESEDPARLAEVEDKARVVAYAHQLARLVRKNKLGTEEGREQMAYYSGLLTELCARVKTLDF